MSREEDRRRYFYDTIYEAYRAGKDSDRIDRDVCNDDFYDGLTPQESAQRQQPPPKHQQEEEQHEEDQGGDAT